MRITTTSAFLIFLFLNFSSIGFAQLNTPRVSQKASVSQTVGITTISINYSRPMVLERKIWGALVPYGMNNLGFGTAAQSPWRAGADENTTITFSTDVIIEGKPLAAGTYGFHMIVEPNDKATVIFSHDADSWGSFFYEESQDALRVEITTKTVPHRELLTYEFNSVTPNSAVISLVWEKKEFPLLVEVDVPKTVLAEMREGFKGEQGFNRQNWENAATYSLNNGGDLNEALVWISNAIEGQFYSQKNANNVAIKAQILSKLGNEAEAEKMYDEAAAMANSAQLNTMGYQMLNAKDFKRALKYFKLNIEKNPKDANGYDSLGEAYQIMGDKANAIKNFKKSLSLNPIPGVKANSEKHLKELEGM
jgi:hypothetical protein